MSHSPSFSQPHSTVSRVPTATSSRRQSGLANRSSRRCRRRRRRATPTATRVAAQYPTSLAPRGAAAGAGLRQPQPGPRSTTRAPPVPPPAPATPTTITARLLERQQLCGLGCDGNGHWVTASGVGAWGAGSPMYGWGYSGYSNPYYGGGFGSGGGSQPIAAQQPAMPSSRPRRRARTTPSRSARPPRRPIRPSPARRASAYDQARAAFKAGDYAQAVQLDQQALAQTPNDATMHEFLALAYFAQGKYQQAAAPLYAVLSVQTRLGLDDPERDVPRR